MGHLPSVYRLGFAKQSEVVYFILSGEIAIGSVSLGYDLLWAAG